MTALMIIGVVLASAGWLMNIAFLSDHGDGKDRTLIRLIASSLLLVSIFFFVLGTEKEAWKSSLDGKNPYRKEYIYKQVDSTYVIIDSVYVKKDN